MDKNLIEKYKSEMLDMYRKSKKVSAVSMKVQENTATAPETQGVNNNPASVPDGKGELIMIVSAFRNIYPVPNAKVTVFTGNYEDMQVVATDFTNQSGRTGRFVLDTPSKELSQQADDNVIPYSVYNAVVSAEGYIDNIHLNIPVFSGVTSLQSSNMMLKETAGEDKGPQIFDESQRFDL